MLLSSSFVGVDPLDAYRRGGGGDLEPTLLGENDLERDLLEKGEVRLRPDLLP